jgi:hypothetical protein
MGVGRAFRRIDLRHAKRDLAVLDLLPKPIELLEFLRVGAHKGRREVDLPLRNALETTDGREGAAVANREIVGRLARKAKEGPTLPKMTTARGAGLSFARYLYLGM